MPRRTICAATRPVPASRRRWPDARAKPRAAARLSILMTGLLIALATGLIALRAAIWLPRLDI